MRSKEIGILGTFLFVMIASSPARGAGKAAVKGEVCFTAEVGTKSSNEKSGGEKTGNGKTGGEKTGPKGK